MTKFEVNLNEKFALIAVSTYVDRELPSERQYAHDLWAVKLLPIGVGNLWEKWLGSILMDRLKKSSLFFIAKGPSTNPELLDGDNKKYMNRVFNFYRGLLLSGFHIVDSPIQLTGVNNDQIIDVREIGELPNPRSISGEHNQNVDSIQLIDAAKVADAIRDLPGRGKLSRFKRILNAFLGGIESYYVEDKIHQFCRCIEGFIYPEVGKTKSRFCSRTELFLGPRNHTLMDHLYDIRSAVEHMHNPLDAISGRSGKEKRLLLLQRSIEAEAVARYCIRHLLLNRNLWQYFENESTLNDFWKNKTNAERQNIWGEPFDIGAVSTGFDPTIYNDADLGF